MLDEVELMDTDTVARRYQLSASWLNKLRLTGNGCPYVKLGRKVLYRKRDIDAWVASQLRKSTSSGHGEMLEPEGK